MENLDSFCFYFFLDVERGQIHVGDKVEIVRADGKAFTVSSSIFSEADRKYLSELRRKSKPNNPVAGLSNLFRRDPAEKMIRKSLNKPIGTITAEDRLSVEVLRGMFKVSNLTPFAELKNLKELNLGWPDNKIADLAPLAGLTKLESLSLGGNNKFTDLSPLAGLTSLKKLFFFINPDGAEVDLAPLGNLVALTDLNFGRTGPWKPTNMDALGKLVNLRKITGNHNDLTPFSDLKNLEELKLNGPPVPDLTPLRNLTSLRQIDLYFAPISPDLSALAKLVNLESLKIGKPLKNKDGGIKDLSPLTGLKNLKELNLRGNKIPDDQKEMLKKALLNCKIQF